ncbi:MAG: transposase, partial [Planctomycetes bacterium]|nr:transposase [Planctomycetota bacterium]
FRWFGRERSRLIEFVCSDMWQPYLKVIAKKAGQAVHVLDRFHIMQHLSKAIDEIRAKEAKKMTAAGYEPVLKRTRWCLLKRPDNLTEKQEVTLAGLLRYNLKTVRAYLLKEDFQGFWDYVMPYWAGRFLDRWCTRTMRSRLEPMKKVARLLRHHRDLILNWCRKSVDPYTRSRPVVLVLGRRRRTRSATVSPHSPRAQRFMASRSRTPQ